MASLTKPSHHPDNTAKGLTAVADGSGLNEGDRTK
jgi:hypothetical protein